MTWLAVLRLIGGWRAAAFLALSVVLGAAVAVQSLRLASVKESLTVEQSAFQAYRDKLTAATARVAALANQARVEYQELSVRAEQNYSAGRESAIAYQNTVVSDLRSGNLRLRNGWQACLSATPGVQAAPGTAQGQDGAPQVQAEAFGRVLRVGADADIQVAWLQAELLATRQLAESCGKTE